MSALFSRLAVGCLIVGLMSPVLTAQEVAGPQGTQIFVRVTQNREIAGTPIDLVEIKVSTSFGDVAIPLAKIDGIKMHADGEDSAVVAFKNGDLVTGKITLETIKLKTDWGTAHIMTSQIETVTDDHNARFYADSSGGAKGWRFTKATPINQGAGNGITVPNVRMLPNDR